MTSDNAVRGEAIAVRMDRLGISSRDLGAQLDIDRQTVARAREGSARSSTMGMIEAHLDRLEGQTGLDEPDPITTTIELPDGVKVTFAGSDPNRVAETVTKFLANRPPLSD